MTEDEFRAALDVLAREHTEAFQLILQRYGPIPLGYSDEQRRGAIGLLRYAVSVIEG